MKPLLVRLAAREWREQICLTGMNPAAWLRTELKPALVAAAAPTFAALLAMWVLAAPLVDHIERAWAICAATVCVLLFTGLLWCEVLDELAKLCTGAVDSFSRRRMIWRAIKLAAISLPFLALCLIALRAWIAPGLLVAVWLHSGAMRRINRHFADACRAYGEFA